MAIKIKQIAVGMLQTNCYIAYHPTTNEALIIDPGAEPERLINEIEKLQLQPKAVLLTHGHFDHAGAAKEVAEHFKMDIYAHEAEKETLESPDVNLITMVDSIPQQYHADIFMRDEQVLNIAGYEIKVIPTPGHTVGGVCFYIEAEGILFSGDSLFYESVGRTDFPKGSASQLIHSVKEKLFILPLDTQVYPGHNGQTSIGHEIDYNPFF